MSVLKEKIKHLFTGYFALVMATGALSIASHLLGFIKISQMLLFCNIIFYTVITILTIVRVIFYFRNVKEDLTSHLKGPGFFTLVAGTNVFGSQLVILEEMYSVAVILWMCSIALWVVIMYAFFTAVTIRDDKPTLAEGINGAWLIATVATQSVAILGVLLIPFYENQVLIGFINFFTLSMFLLGCMLYLSIITLIFYRFTFLHLKHASLTPPYWINMGAVAITTLAGSLIIINAVGSPFVEQFVSFIKGFTLFFWVTGTWWIPLLVILMYWRYIVHRFPINYDYQMWGMVFPLAMYTTSTYQLSEALAIPFLKNISHVFIFPAWITWGFGILLLIVHLYMDLVRQK
ncbi:tellurite resistance/C4-dicarboxylate transporter family protein [Gracilibacillus lacisalsi]|uniref:tellurite resistance/C4-dicarboxylate transporter family protein n=1 Tax=Gracilibacillus lacisalsi TaxID=393087 RepID=UPI000362B8C0|nr:tellurite resistance/C4-dicarboxylate transporter family protein [Gracilibacillus lacisalsi]